MVVLEVAVAMPGERIYLEPIELLHHSSHEDQALDVRARRVESSSTWVLSELHQEGRFGEFGTSQYFVHRFDTRSLVVRVCRWCRKHWEL
jgi:hypothetical protein